MVAVAALASKIMKHFPLPRGPYQVGCADLMTGYGKDGSFMRLYYPTVQMPHEDHQQLWCPWYPDDKYIDGIANISQSWSGKLFKMVHNTFIDQYLIPSSFETPLLQNPSTPPKVIVFSHGLCGWRTSYSIICNELASRGFVVAAVEHRDETAAATCYRVKEFGDSGGSVKTEWLIHRWIALKDPTHNEQRKAQVQIRASECIRTLDILHDLNNGGSVENVLDTSFDFQQFKGQLDLQQPILMGHSFGGVTTVLGLAKEKRFSIGISLDAWMYPIKSMLKLPNEISQPLLFINMETFQIAANLKVMRTFQTIPEDNNEETNVITIKGADHLHQCDAIHVYNNRLVKWLTSSRSNHDPYLIGDVNMGLVLEFINKHLGVPELDEFFEKKVEENKNLLLYGIQLGENHL